MPTAQATGKYTFTVKTGVRPALLEVDNSLPVMVASGSGMQQDEVMEMLPTMDSTVDSAVEALGLGKRKHTSTSKASDDHPRGVTNVPGPYPPSTPSKSPSQGPRKKPASRGRAPSQGRAPSHSGALSCGVSLYSAASISRGEGQSGVSLSYSAPSIGVAGQDMAPTLAFHNMHGAINRLSEMIKWNLEMMPIPPPFQQAPLPPPLPPPPLSPPLVHPVIVEALEFVQERDCADLLMDEQTTLIQKFKVDPALAKIYLTLD